MECSVGSSKHLQTRRFLDTIKQYFVDVRTMIVQLHRQANERPRPLEPSSPRQKQARLQSKQTNQLVDSAPQKAEERKPERKVSLKRTGSEVRVLNWNGEGSEEEDDDIDLDLVTSGYSFFDSGDVEVLNPQRRRPLVGEHLSDDDLESLSLIFCRTSTSSCGILRGIIEIALLSPGATGLCLKESYLITLVTCIVLLSGDRSTVVHFCVKISIIICCHNRRCISQDEVHSASNTREPVLLHLLLEVSIA